MKDTLTNSMERDHAEALRALPKAFRDAPRDIQKEWLLARARQLGLLRAVAIGFVAIFVLLGILQVRNAFVINAAQLLLFAFIIAAAVFAARGLAAARLRYEAYASVFSSDEEAP